MPTSFKHGPPTQPAQQYNNCGIVVRNKKKQQDNDKDKDFYGSATVMGVEFYISGWVREKENEWGKYKYLKLYFTRKQKQNAETPGT